MFKFIRKYQKWMLVVFCGVLMVAFLIQPVMSIFFPDQSKRTIGTIEGGGKITEQDKVSAINSLNTLRSLGFYGVGLYPQEDSEGDQGLAWLLMVRGGQMAGLGASDNEAFSALSIKQADITDVDTLDAFAADRKTTRAALLGVVKEYLIAEQYRQLVLGHAFETRDGYSGSPGLMRVRLENEAVQAAVGDQQWQLQFFQQTGRFPTENDLRTRVDSMVFGQTVGHPRVSENALRHAVQENQTRLSGQLVVIDATESTLPPSDEQMQKLFEQYRADFAGTGETYGFGYRIPAKVRIEALRIPLQAVMAVAAQQVTEADVRRYYDQHVALYADWTPRDQEPAPEEETPEESPETSPEGEATPDDAAPETTPEGDAEAAPEGETQAPESTDGTQPGEGEGDAEADPADDQPAVEEPELIAEPAPGPGERVRIDFRLRREIRAALTLQKAREMQLEIAQDIQRILAEDSRVLAEDNGFKVVPEGFVPRPLTEIAQRIAQDHGVELEVVADDGTWVSLPEMTESLRFVGGMMQTMPTRSFWSADSGFAIQEERLPSTELEGRLGLVSSGVIDETGRMIAQTRQLVGLTRELLPDGQAASMPRHPQVGLALPQPLADASGSVYIARVTGAQKDRPADSLAEVREDVERDAKLKQGYDNLLAREEELLAQAREYTIHDLARDEVQVVELNGFTRGQPPAVDGINPANMGPLVDAAFELAQTLRAAGGVDAAVSSDRLIAVPFPYERKLAVFLLDEDQPVSRRTYQAMIDPAGGNAVRDISLERTMPEGGNPRVELIEPLSLQALIRQTGFEYAEDEGPDADDGASDGGESEDE